MKFMEGTSQLKYAFAYSSCAVIAVSRNFVKIMKVDIEYRQKCTEDWERYTITKHSSTFGVLTASDEFQWWDSFECSDVFRNYVLLALSTPHQVTLCDSIFSVEGHMFRANQGCIGDELAMQQLQLKAFRIWSPAWFDNATKSTQ